MHDTVRIGKEWEDPYLVQRLLPPYPKDKAKRPTSLLLGAGQAAGPFSFGGGLVGGGLSKEANEALGEVFCFDYMGAAEYEWGIVPSAIQALAKQQDTLVAFEIIVQVQQPRKLTEHLLEPNTNKSKVSKTVYGLCPDSFQECARTWLASEAFGLDYGQSTTRDPTRLWHSFWESQDSLSRVVGGLDCTNGWMFFSDQEAFLGTCQLFEIPA